MKRSFWLLIGVISLALGLVGVVLPLLPTTPFILLSALSFANSSPKLHAWLVNHPRWGPIIHNWEDGGRIDRKSKAVALILMSLMPMLSWFLAVPLWVVGIQVMVLILVGIFILSRPS